MSTAAITAGLNYQGYMQERPAYYATDYSRDRLALETHRVAIRDRRRDRDRLALDKEGFLLVDQVLPVVDFQDDEQVSAEYIPRMGELLRSLTGASRVLMNPRGVLRFSERSQRYGSRTNTRPARFVHVDFTDLALPVLLGPQLESAGLARIPGTRYVGFNLWRVLTPPPQDVPLCVCEMDSLAASDLVRADAVFDAPGRPEFSFEGYLVHYNRQHRWCWFSDMQPDEVLIFKSHDTAGGPLACVPHVAFDNPDCPPGAPPRASIEVRGFALFE